MIYEMAVLAALVQIEQPSRPKIAKETGISAQRINTALTYLREYLDLDIVHCGARKNGFYEVVSWGAFESGNLIRKKALSLNLEKYRDSRELEYDTDLAKVHYANSVKMNNYIESLKLEGFEAQVIDVLSLNKKERAQKRRSILLKYAPDNLKLNKSERSG